MAFEDDLLNVEVQDNNLTVNKQAEKYLHEIRKWGLFLAVIGFIVGGLLILTGGWIGATMNPYELRSMGVPFSPMAFLILYCVLGLLYLLPALFTFAFAKRAENALYEHDARTLDRSFRSLRALFRFKGILTLIAVLVITVLFLVRVFMGMTFL